MDALLIFLPRLYLFINNLIVIDNLASSLHDRHKKDLLMAVRILLVNPPIFDFSAYDFWLKPYGMLTVAGYLRGQADFFLFDYLDRLHPSLAGHPKINSDHYGRGSFPKQKRPKPEPLKSVQRHFHRYGRAQAEFQTFLQQHSSVDMVWIQTTMTYWYPGVREVIEDVRAILGEIPIVLGGPYATLCPVHARSLGADLIIEGNNCQPLWDFLRLPYDEDQPALWELYDRLEVGIQKITQGCPFACTYCSVNQVYGGFQTRSLNRIKAEYDMLVQHRVKHVAFYDDALLFHPQEVLEPLLHHARHRGVPLQLHSPNALNARFLTPELAQTMVVSGFKTFYLGFESASPGWQQATGSKVTSPEFAQAVSVLVQAGARRQNITAYQILGHPQADTQALEESMHYVASLGIRGMLSDFSPIPGTPDGEACRQWVDLDEPLFHNKTAFPILTLGFKESNRFKDLQRQLNHQVRFADTF